MDQQGQDQRGQDQPGRRRGVLGELGAAVRRGSVMPLQASAPAGRAERLGLAPVHPATSQAEALPSAVVHGGHRHRIGGELAGTWSGRPAILFDFELATDYGARGDGDGGVLRSRFHVGVLGLRVSLPWFAVSRQEIREHLARAGRGTQVPGTGRLDRIRLLASQEAAALPPPDAFLRWAGQVALTGAFGHKPVCVIEVSGPWVLAAVQIAGMEHSDENAAALATKLGRPERGPWPERLLAMTAEAAARLDGGRSS